MDKKNIMPEIMSLCILYHNMYSAEDVVRRQTDDENRELAYKIYIKTKAVFDKQFKKVEGLINE